MKLIVKYLIIVMIALGFSGCISASLDIGNSGNKNQQMMAPNPYYYPPPYYY